MVRLVAKIKQTLDEENKQKDKESNQKKLVHAKRTAELAENEIKTGFPLLHALAVVNLWTFLEALIHSFMCSWIKNIPNSLLIDPIPKLKIKIGDYERLNKAERISYIAELLDKELGAGLRHGVNRFEVLLEPLGLSGSIPDWVRRDIYELAQVRNAIVHRIGVTDRQLKNECPWLKLKLGDEIVVTHKMFTNYMEAAHSYVTELIYRVGEKYGVDMSKERSHLQKKPRRKNLPNDGMQPIGPTGRGG